MPPPPRDLRVDRALVAVSAVALTLLVWPLAQGNGPGADTIAWAPAAGNGLSLGDWPILVLWLVGLALCGLQLRPRASRTVDVLLVAASGVLLTFLALTLVKGDGPDSGETLLAFTHAYGVNTGDLPVLAVWLAGVATCMARLRQTGTGR